MKCWTEAILSDWTLIFSFPLPWNAWVCAQDMNVRVGELALSFDLAAICISIVVIAPRTSVSVPWKWGWQSLSLSNKKHVEDELSRPQNLQKKPQRSKNLSTQPKCWPSHGYQLCSSEFLNRRTHTKPQTRSVIDWWSTVSPAVGEAQGAQTKCPNHVSSINQSYRPHGIAAFRAVARPGSGGRSSSGFLDQRCPIYSSSVALATFQVLRAIHASGYHTEQSRKSAFPPAQTVPLVRAARPWKTSPFCPL